MTVATIWIEGTNKEGHGKNEEEALAALKKGWEQTCDNNPDRDRDYLANHAEDIEYSDA